MWYPMMPAPSAQSAPVLQGIALSPKSPQDRRWWVQMATISTLGIAMVISLMLGVLGGWWLDRMWGTRIFFWIGLVVGILAAYRNLWVMYDRYLRDKPDHKPKG